MSVTRTFSIIKPDATRRNLTGKINARFEEKGLRIVAQKRIWMSRQQAEQFYGVHKARPFFGVRWAELWATPLAEVRKKSEGLSIFMVDLRLAEQAGIKRMKLSTYCEENGIKIKGCQLGAF